MMKPLRTDAWYVHERCCGGTLRAVSRGEF